MRQLENSSIDTMCALHNLNNFYYTYFLKGNISFYNPEHNIPGWNPYSAH